MSTRARAQKKIVGEGEKDKKVSPVQERVEFRRSMGPIPETPKNSLKVSRLSTDSEDEMDAAPPAPKKARLEFQSPLSSPAVSARKKTTGGAKPPRRLAGICTNPMPSKSSKASGQTVLFSPIELVKKKKKKVPTPKAKSAKKVAAAVKKPSKIPVPTKKNAGKKRAEGVKK